MQSPPENNSTVVVYTKAERLVFTCKNKGLEYKSKAKIAEDLTQRGTEILQQKLPVKWQPTEIKDHKKKLCC